MKSLALAAVLFCALAGLLGYMALTGFGARASNADPVVVDRTALQEMSEPAVNESVRDAPPEVEVNAVPAKAVAAKHRPNPAKVASKTKGWVAPPRPSAVVVVAPKPQPSTVTATRKPEKVTKQTTAPLVARAAPKDPPVTPKVEPSVQAAVRAAETEEQALKRQIDEDRKWRQETISRWQREEAQREARERKALEKDFDERGRLKERRDDMDHSMGMEEAKKVDDPKKKKKKRRRTFLGIRL